MDTTETQTGASKMSNTQTKEQKVRANLRRIAWELNRKDAEMPSDFAKEALGYNFYHHAVMLAEQVGLEIDEQRQEREDAEAAYAIYFEGGWSLVVSCDEWCVSEPDADAILEDIRREDDARCEAGMEAEDDARREAEEQMFAAAALQDYTVWTENDDPITVTAEDAEQAAKAIVDVEHCAAETRLYLESGFKDGSDMSAISITVEDEDGEQAEFTLRLEEDFDVAL
jgi:hypothetical protein